MKTYLIVAYSLIFLFSNWCLIAQTRTWDGGAGTHNWEDSDNWNPNGLPTLTDVILIEGDSVHISIASSPGVRNVELRQAILTNESRLGAFPNYSNNGPCIRLTDSSRLHQSGILFAGLSDQDGIYCESGSEVVNIGEIFITHTRSGIYLEQGSSFFNSHMINIDSCSMVGIENRSRFINTSLGIINIEGSTNGIINTEQFENSGYITISFTSDRAIANKDAFSNMLLGSITILESKYGINNTEVFENHGVIEINDGLENSYGLTLNSVSAVFRNFGTITLDSLGAGIFYNVDSTTFVNEIGSQLNILNMFDEASEGISMNYPYCQFYNYDHVLIDGGNRYGIGLFGGFFHNSDTVIIQNILDYGILHESNCDLIIDSTGYLQISQCGTPYEISTNGSTFNCEGEIDWK